MTKIDGSDPDYDHNFMLGSAVYNLLREHSEEASDILHDSPHRSPYVLSEIHGVKGKPGEWWFRLGTSSGAVAKIAGKALTPSTKLSIRETSFQVTGIVMEEPSALPGEYVTLSPILLRDKETRKSIVHDSPNYPETLENAINAQVKNHLKKEGTIKVVHFESQAVRKRKIKDRTVLAQKGRMLLDGDDEELSFIVNHGIGSSPALGFGMIVLNKKKCANLRGGLKDD